MSKEIPPEEECFLHGSVKLPSQFFNNGHVNVFGQSNNISKEGTYCIKEKPSNRNELKIQVYNKTNLVLENTIVYRGQKSIKHDITLEQAMAEVTCREDVCTYAQVKTNLQSPYIKEYTTKTIEKYYKVPEKVDYEKIIKKMSRQDRNVRNASEKLIKKESKNDFIPLPNEMRATNYKTFSYSKADLRKYFTYFEQDKEPILGLTDKDSTPEYIVTQWARMAFFYGNDLKSAGRFYTEEFKTAIIEEDTLERPLLFTAVYKNKAKSKSRVRTKNDEMYFKKSIKEANGMFKKQYGVVINSQPTYVDIEFIFENGSWRMNRFDVNEKYLKYISKK